MWWWAISHLYCFCDYWSIAVNSMDKLQFLTCIIIYHQAQTTLWRVTQNKSYDVLLVKFRPCDGWVQPHCRSAIWICMCDHIRWNLFWGLRTHGGSNVAHSQYFWLFQQLQSWQYDDDDEEQFTIYRFPFHGDMLIQLTRLSSWCMPRAAAAANQSPWRFTYAHTGYVPLEYVPWHSIKKVRHH